MAALTYMLADLLREQPSECPFAGLLRLPVKEADAERWREPARPSCLRAASGGQQARALDAALRDVAAQVWVGTNNTQVDDQGGCTSRC